MQHPTADLPRVNVGRSEFMGGCDIVRGMYEDGSLTEALANYKAGE